ncbi:MAG: hypothetical protein PHU85_18590 [Phycisphaerae bacterium]|nr:hypothetical protein [Phycisphaerae bacterium]
MILAYHVILSAYGFWLPNDPRGSWSDFVAAWELLKFGPAAKAATRRSVADRPHDIARRLEAKAYLKYSPVSFSGIQARAIGIGFANQVQHSDLTIWACSILPEHVHLVVKRHAYKIERAAILLKGSATRELTRQGINPMSRCAEDGTVPSPWGHKFWKVFLDSAADVRRAIQYVIENPVREGKPRQQWACVREIGEMLNSPGE